MRLDISLSGTHHCSRNKAQAFIRDGLVTVDGKVITKPSHEIMGNEEIVLEDAKKTHWVSRSAGKLDGFIEKLGMKKYELNIVGATCLDVGSSTGGFTQVLLERGAKHVDAVDVGTDQLHEQLRDDPRISSYEQTDIRAFVSIHTDTHLPIYDIIVCDASFISLQEIFPSMRKLGDQHTRFILLWKPQFEVGRSALNRKTGVPKDPARVETMWNLWKEYLISTHCDIIYDEQSSVIGEAGNQEYLLYVKIR